VALFRRFLSRHWQLAILAVAALIVGATMLHPYPRQSLFGPTIRGEPWCYWEDEIRWDATRDRDEAKRSDLGRKIRTWLGFKREIKRPGFFNDEKLLPVFLKLTDDSDMDVRWYAVSSIVSCEGLYQEPALPIFRQQLDEGDTSTQINCAKAIWRISKDREMIAVLRRILQSPNTTYHKVYALEALSEIAREQNDVFPEIASFARHDAEGLRNATMGAMGHFGKQGVPVLLSGLKDPDEWVRLRAASSLRGLRTGEKEMISALERLVVSEDGEVRSRAAKVLLEVDPIRFAHLKAD
jgi:HEAT repeat protein